MRPRWVSVITAVGALVSIGLVTAQIVTDGTLAGIPAKFPVPLQDGRFTITDNLGVIKGANRFHSFSEFGIPSGQRVVFTSEAALKNILTRVTGGRESVIQGPIESRVAGANLFLINPSGICFKSGSALELTGDFTATTADYLGFEDGERFDASHPDNPVLTSAPPSAFGFADHLTRAGSGTDAGLTAGNAATGAGKVSIRQATLEVEEGRSLRLVGGDVTVGDLSGAQTSVRAPSGQVVLGSVKSAGEVPLAMPPRLPLSPTVQGTIRLTGRARVETTPARSSAPNGRIVVRGGRLQVENAQLVSDSLHADGGLTVDVAMTGDVALTGLNGAIRSDSSAPEGTPAEVSIMAQNLDVTRGTISVQANGVGAGSTLRLDVEESITLHDGVSLLDAHTGGQASGAGATVEVQTGRLEVRDATLSLDNNGTGPGATLGIQADEVVVDRATVFVGTFGPGPGGLLRLGTADRPVGDVRLANGSRFVADAGDLFSDAGSGPPSGPAGTVEVHAHTIRVDGSSPAPTGFFAQTRGTAAARGGTILMDTAQLELSGPNAMVSSSTSGEAPGGAIWIQAGGVTLDQGASIRSESTGSGAAGAVNLLAQGSLTLRDGSLISAAGPKGGDVTLCAGDRIYLLESQVSASSTSDTGGNLLLGLPPPDGWLDLPPAWPGPEGCLPPVFVVMNRGLLNASSAGGQGGNVSVGSRYYLPSGDSVVNVTGTEGTGTPSTPTGLDFSGQLTTPIQARPEDLAEASEQRAFVPIDPAGYTPIGRGDAGEVGGDRRLILDRPRRPGE